ncbi:UTP--glucose-1-phosphate uridylyltransferase family protein [Tritrichomonas foetus]|uniref:UDP-N-acetylglucosamine diphosphorylase n=1 Tax=Tritrichomonas foetus TaxID=1144522 RepID=A0A1J4L0P7_9EUKA|nr:UTP--glucose-1-phosphate uridylyltransferase family protein [Tritrichomonas foetus]|eukprot:OHT17011.1 UTP--glucose-1-phosphate uridylyltransferase family protein [Tritrichomonas foetus]
MPLKKSFMKFVVCSGDSKIISAVEEVLHKTLDGKVEFSIESEGNVNRIYTNLQSTKQAAVARIYNSRIEKADYYISIVSGIEREFDLFYGFSFAAVSDGLHHKFGFGTSAKYPLPDDLCFEIEDGRDINEIVENEENGLVSIATGSALTICDLVRSSVGVALIPFNFYPLPESKQEVPSELIQFSHDLTSLQHSNLTSKINSYDFNKETPSTENTQNHKKIEVFSEPVDYSENSEDVYVCGVDAIRRGEVAVLLLTGGNGKKLNLNSPKALMNLQIPSKMTLLELQMRRIKKLVKMFNSYGQNTPDAPVYIVTNDSTHSAIAAYLIKHNYFGLEHVMLVQQRENPVKYNNKFALREKWNVLTASSGSGSLFEALYECGALEDMRKRGVQYVDIHNVDNILAKPADPYFVGAMMYEEGDIAVKAIHRMPFEHYQPIVNVDGKPTIVDFSEIPKEDELKHIWCNSNLYMFNFDVIERIVESLLSQDNDENYMKDHFVTRKEIIVGENGEKVEVEVCKQKKFLSDALQYAETPVILECIREEEFGQIKLPNGSQLDTSEISIELMDQLHKKWAADAGIACEGEGHLEFLPETTYAGEGLEDIRLAMVVLPIAI